MMQNALIKIKKIFAFLCMPKLCTEQRNVQASANENDNDELID